MRYCSPDVVKATRARPSKPFLFASLGTIVLLLLSLSACAGVSVPGSSSTASTPTPTPAPPPPPPPSASSLTMSGTLPSATVGSSYDATLSVSGGTAPYVFSLASGQLPAGVLLADATGVISGTPTAVGNFIFAISVSDSKGLSSKQSLQITVSNSSTTTAGNSFSNLQQSSGWESYGQGPPDFVDCSPSPCDGITFSMSQGVSSPSMSGSAAQFNLGGTAAYTDALFNNHLIGAFLVAGPA